MPPPKSHRAGKWIGICGKLGASKDFLPLFVGMGAGELSHEWHLYSGCCFMRCGS